MSISLDRLEELRKNYHEFYMNNYKILNSESNIQLITSRDLIDMLIQECKTGVKIADPRW